MDSALLNIISPELILALGAIALLMLGVFSPEGEKTGRVVGWLAIGVLTAAIVAMFQQTGVSHAFEGAFVSDPLTRFFKIMILVAAIVALVLTFESFARDKLLVFEYPVLVLLAALGMMVMVSANDLITLYLGLELQNLSLYVITAFKRHNV